MADIKMETQVEAPVQVEAQTQQLTVNTDDVTVINTQPLDVKQLAHREVKQEIKRAKRHHRAKRSGNKQQHGSQPGVQPGVRLGARREGKRAAAATTQQAVPQQLWKLQCQSCKDMFTSQEQKNVLCQVCFAIYKQFVVNAPFCNGFRGRGCRARVVVKTLTLANDDEWMDWKAMAEAYTEYHRDNLPLVHKHYCQHCYQDFTVDKKTKAEKHRDWLNSLPLVKCCNSEVEEIKCQNLTRFDGEAYAGYQYCSECWKKENALSADYDSDYEYNNNYDYTINRDVQDAREANDSTVVSQAANAVDYVETVDDEVDSCHGCGKLTPLVDEFNTICPPCLSMVPKYYTSC